MRSIELFHPGHVRFSYRAIQAETKGLRHGRVDTAKSRVTAGYRENHFAHERVEPGPRASELDARKDGRQAARFTANARFKVLNSGRLRLPKIGDVQVRWSRDLPSEPSSVTVIRDAAGRYFASFAVDTDPARDAARFPEASAEVGIDLGLTVFAVLSDGTVIRSPQGSRMHWGYRRISSTTRARSDWPSCAWARVAAQPRWSA